jgi:hypothetical protein
VTTLLTVKRSVLLTAVIAIFLIIFAWVALQHHFVPYLKLTARAHRRNNDKTRTLWAMFATIVFMYSCGVVNFALSVWVFASYPDVSMLTVLVTLIFGFSTVRHSLLAVRLVLKHPQVFLSDCIIVWRAWILWRRSRAVMVATVTLLLSGLGASRSTVRLQITHSSPGLFILSLTRIDVRAILLSPDMVPFDWILSFGMSVLTNVYTTILVGIRTWYVLDPRRVFRPHEARVPGNTGTSYAAAGGHRCRSRSLSYSSSPAPYTL